MDRYSCTNHRKRLPIDDLGGARCSNSKTIARQDVEERVLDCLPAAFFSIGAFETMSANVIAEETSSLRRPEAEWEQIRQELKELERRQKAIIQQITDRAAEGRPRLSLRRHARPTGSAAGGIGKAIV
jgi:hypothetical protein